ncbi:MAG: acetyltransferase [Acidobacteria bacterium]|nr:acetyltransferase [Acidobacteriota bacterium]
MQKIIWGFEDIELLPRRLFVVANKVGGQTLGAFDGKKMVAFLIAIPGLKAGGKYYLHSHMLGTLAAYRDRGLGRSLKLLQRQEALSRGIPLIEWTFDPMELKNAFFNMERLGAVVRRYVPNQYGTTSSHLHGGLPTDRCVAEWYIDSPRVHAIVSKQPFNRPAYVEKICVPAGIADIRKNDPARAREVQDSLREQFQRHFRNGLEVSGFESTAKEGIYLLSELESK